MILNYDGWKKLLEARESSVSYPDELIVYHVSSKEIDQLGDRPLWFALEKSHSDDGWLANTLDAEGQAFQYRAVVVGRFANLKDPEVLEIFDQVGEDPQDWLDWIVGNPSAEEVLELTGTKALIGAGYAGIVYLDYDPRDWSQDLEALLVFDAARWVKEWRLISQVGTP
jgi:hypothetical protein